MFVLSPDVATTAASALSIPARTRTSVVHPVADDEPALPVLPSRASASSFSSTAVTSQPSADELLRDRRADAATSDHDCLHARSVAHAGAVMRCPRRRPRGTRRRAPRRGRCGGRGRRSARRSATGGASAATSRARSGRHRGRAASSTIAWPIERALTVRVHDLDAVLLPERTRLGEGLPPRAGGRPPGSAPSSGNARGTRTTKIASTVGAALLRERDRRRHHLLADVAELHRHEHLADTPRPGGSVATGSTSSSTPDRRAGAGRRRRRRARRAARPGRRTARPGA